MPLGCAQIGKGVVPVMELEDIGSKHTLSTWDRNRGPNVAACCATGGDSPTNLIPKYAGVIGTHTLFRPTFLVRLVFIEGKSKATTVVLVEHKRNEV